MLVESGNSETCRKITGREVVERLSHIDSTMLTKIYARIRPPEMGTENIDEYLDLPELVVNGVSVNEGEAAFDCWLLAHMIGMFKGRAEEKELMEGVKKEVQGAKPGRKSKKRIEV